MMKIKIKKILVATDFSKAAECAYPVAQKIATTFGSKVDFIHIIPTIKYLNESLKKMGTPLDINKDIYPKIREESEQLISKAMVRFIRKENKGRYFVKIDRKPSEAIVEHASKNSYDLIVLAARGMHDTHMMRGGTTQKVIRNSRVPVFSVDESFNEKQIKNILVPTDTSPLSLSAFPLAAKLADAYSSSITLLNVVELYGSISEEIPYEPEKGQVKSIYDGLIERLNNYLADAGVKEIHIQRTGIEFEDQVVITKREENRPLRLFTKVEKGISAHHTIERYAEEHADLVVMATHGYSGFAHLILGSTAEKVAQYVTKPVITIRPDKDQFTG